MEKYSMDGRIVPTINGGHGSGNFGHSGRPGKVGGSGKGTGSAKEQYAKKYPTDYQKDDVPDIPLDQITKDNIEHLDTQVRERLLEMKERAEQEKQATKDKHDFNVEGYRGSTQELASLFPKGDNFYSDGELMHIKEDENGTLYGESEDGKRVVETPGQVLDGTA